MNGMCASIAAALTFAIGAEGSERGAWHWIRPPRTFLGIEAPLEESSKPPRDNHLLIRVELVRVSSMDLQVAEEAVLGAAEGEVGHGRGHPDVDADHRCGGVPGELP